MAEFALGACLDAGVCVTGPVSAAEDEAVATGISRSRGSGYAWAELMARVLSRAILECIGLPTHASRVAPAGSPCALPPAGSHGRQGKASACAASQGSTPCTSNSEK